MHYLHLRNKTEPKVFQCLCTHSLHLSLTEFLVCSFAFPKPNHFWKAGDPFTFIYLYISPQRTIMFNCYCRLYFTVAQGCVKKGVFGLWLEHVIWNMLFYWFTNAPQAESFTIHVTNKLYPLSEFTIGSSSGPEVWLKLRQEKYLLSDCFCNLDLYAIWNLLPFIWQAPVDCPSN